MLGNILSPGSYGVKGSGTADGVPSLRRYWDGVTWAGNTLTGASAPRLARYPVGRAAAP